MASVLMTPRGGLAAHCRPCGAKSSKTAFKLHRISAPRQPCGRVSTAARLSARHVAASAAAAAGDAAFPDDEGKQQQQQQPLKASDSQQQQQQPAADAGSSGRGALWWVLGACAAFALGVGALIASGHAGAVRAAIVDGPLGRSGFAAAFSLIFLSEIGDKTFFIAALLAMRLGRLVAFTGSVAALAAMTGISVGIGVAFSRVPDALMTSLPVGELAGVALLVVFGVRALRAAAAAEPSGGAEDELEDAQSTVAEAESAGRVRAGGGGRWRDLVEVGSIVFLAEWGDRSMLATIALGAAQSPLGVAVGATAGHAAATAIAVIGGAIAGQHVSERTVNAVSGALFLLFAAATVVSML